MSFMLNGRVDAQDYTWVMNLSARFERSSNESQFIVQYVYNIFLNI